MERKKFLSAAAGTAAALAATGLAANAALVAPGPISTPNPPVPVTPGSPYPGRHYWERNQFLSDRNITRVRRRLERVIDELQRDQADYGGHKEKANDLLQRAREELLLAEKYDTQHPDGRATARPF